MVVRVRRIIAFRNRGKSPHVSKVLERVNVPGKERRDGVKKEPTREGPYHKDDGWNAVRTGWFGIGR